LPHIVEKYVKQVEACTRAGLSGIDEKPLPGEMALPEEAKVLQRQQLEGILNQLEFQFS
jgi:hypothetical protein